MGITASTARDCSPSTLLDVFISVSQNPSTASDIVVEHGTEVWSYGDLDSISTGLAIQLREQYGLKPTITAISENHPYVLAILLATWKLGGIFAPIDGHAPPDMMRKMLENVEPTCVVVPDTEIKTIELLRGMNIPFIPFVKADSTVTALAQRFIDQSAESPFDLPTASTMALYLHTSSASGPSNLKCVKISHATALRGSSSRLQWWRRIWPLTSFNKLRVLGWAPWSHLLAITHDIGAGAILTGGCYVFGSADSNDSQPSRDSDVLNRLLDAIIRVQPDVFACVPWALEGLKERYLRLENKSRAAAFRHALRHIKSLSCGGASLSAEGASWARELGLNMINDIGMTELGGPIYYFKLELDENADSLWSNPYLVIDDAKVKLVDEEGKEVPTEGELVVSSTTICEGYLKYDNSAFSKSKDGVITFKTGDIYEKLQGGRYIWKGRKDDYIQMVSSETFDPRPLEVALTASPGIAHACVVGNNFMRKASDYLIAIIEPVFSESISSLSSSERLDITRAVAAVNKTLPPPLRISWSRVVILEKGLTIPFTRKGAVFRKKLEMVFGDTVASLEKKDDAAAPVVPPSHHKEESSTESTLDPSDGIHRGEGKKWKSEDVVEQVVNAVAGVLAIKADMLRANSSSSFAEFGMDSNMAIRIVKVLNEAFSLHLPPNACHTYIDLAMLSRAILTELGNHENPSLTEGTRTPSSATQKEELEEIVIVGQSLRLPGDINTPDLFWEALVNKRKDIATKVPEDRWDHASFYRAPDAKTPQQPGDITFEKAGFIDVAHFDNSFFGISAPEAYSVSPTIRLTLETAFEALEDACIPLSKIKGTSMGIYVAAGLNEGYNQLLYHDKGFQAYSRFFGTGIASSVACGRLSYLLDVHGPSTTVDTACSSGLVAFHDAVKFLQSGEGESAIVAAANSVVWPGSFGFLSAQKMASVNSRCATFTNEANGYMPSEGAVAFILKTKSAALRDNDNILGVVRATEVRHGGRSQGLAAPNVNAQIELQRSLISKAHLQPSDIDFLETHGTGTSLGDMIEIQGINEVFQHSHHGNPLILGAAKSCIGHTETAAGLVGLLKVLGTLKYSAVPGLTNLTESNINPNLDRKTVPLLIPVDAVPLPIKPEDVPHRGLVLSNGFAGTIAGAIIDAPTGLDTANSDVSLEPTGPALFVVSAKTAEALEEYLDNYLSFCRKADPKQLHSICYTTCVGREHYRYRFATVVSSMEQLIQSLEDRIENFTSSFRSTASGITFAFPGQGSHYQGMAAGLANAYPAFKDTLVFAAASASKVTRLPIASFLLDSVTECEVSMDDTQASQVSIFVYQYSIAMWLQTLGIVPASVLGHSLGEIAASVLAGALSFDLGLELVATRAKILRSDPSQPSGMAIVATSKERIHDLINQLGLGGRIVIAVYNGSQSHVVSGELVAIDAFLAKAKSSGIRGAKLKVSQGFHSPSIHPSLPVLQEWLDNNAYFLSSLQLPLYSTAYGTEIPAGARLKPSHWIQHARDAVRFSDAIEAVSSSKAVDVVLDIGPQPFVWTVLQSLPHSKVAIATTTKPSGDQKAAFMKSIAVLFEHGLTIDLTKLYPTSSQLKKVSIPTYPFQRQRHYPVNVPSRNQTIKSGEVAATSLARSVPFPVDQPLFDLLEHHKIEGRRVSPGAALADFFARLAPSKSLKTITFNAPLVLEDPAAIVMGEIEADGRFSMHNSDSNSTKVVTGFLLPTKSAVPRIKADQGGECTVLDHQTIYDSFKSVIFGAPFRNIQEIRSYATHADALITLKPTQYTTLDRIRKLDPCLHMFGAIAQREVPQIRDLDGSFLPTSLEDFTLHTDTIPDSFICRYRLPLTATRNYQVISTALEVISLTGELILSCKKYSVAWIPAGVVIQNKEPTKPSDSEHWLQQTWVSEPAPSDINSSSPVKKSEKMLYISAEGQKSCVSDSFTPFANHASFLRLPTDSEVGSSWSSGITNLVGAGELSIVLDLTSLDVPPTSPKFANVHRHILVLLQLLGRCKATITNFVVVSQLSVSAYPDSGAFLASEATTSASGASAIAQGMVRVFRREAALDDAVWALDLPALKSVDDSELRHLIFAEMNLRLAGSTKHRTVRFREVAEGGFTRVVPALRRASVLESSEKIQGVSLIVGLGDIGSALAPALLAKGCSKVVFIGRRSAADSEISKTLERLRSSTADRCEYIQADVCDIISLRHAMNEIRSRFGSIEHIIHTAAVIQDATIQNVDFASFDRVLNPKVIGAWNLHLLSEQLCPSLKSFVLLSSISVSLGNQGQVAYVAGNFFMETLAAHRLARSLPGVCLQLGAWESRAIEDLNMDDQLVTPMDNETGIPLIIKAMSVAIPAQLVVKLDMKKLAVMPAYSRDPLFAGVLPQSANSQVSIKKLSDDEVSVAISNVLRNVLELRPSEKLEPTESLTACGIDSISFAQVRGKVMADLQIEIPMTFLSDSFTIQDMIVHVTEKYRSQ